MCPRNVAFHAGDYGEAVRLLDGLPPGLAASPGFAEARRIVERIDTDLAVHPGKDKALTGQYKGLFSFRVGDYRVVYAMLADAILVLRIAHRTEAYR